MNKEDRRILDAVNAELERLGSNSRFIVDKFWPMNRRFTVPLENLRYAQIHPSSRTMSVFTYDSSDTCWGSLRVIGKGYSGRGWLEKLVSDAVTVVLGREARSEQKGS